MNFSWRSWFVSSEGKWLLLARKMVVNVCVFTLICFLAKCVSHSLIVVRYLRRMKK